MDIASPVSAEISTVKFSFFNTQDIRRISAKLITNPVVLDALGRPAADGLYDLHLGPIDKSYM